MTTTTTEPATTTRTTRHPSVSGAPATAPAAGERAPRPRPQPRPPRAPAAQGTAAFEIRDRLIELDDLRRRGILSEEEFAAKKSELLNRI